MSVQVFDWKVTTRSTGDGELKVDTANFGDGYKQVAAKGINNDEQTWQVSFEGYGYECQPVIDFIRAHAGGTPFLWKPPLGALAHWTCAKYSVTPVAGDYYVLTFTFAKGYMP